MITAHHLYYSFPNKDLYQDISFTLEEGQHCAFIGTSGSGKSTLIDMILSPDKYAYEGTLDITPNLRIGYVSQCIDRTQMEPMTVFEYIAEDCLKLQQKLMCICSEMETALDIDPLLEAYQATLDAFDAAGGDDFESFIDKKLNLAHLTKHRDLKISELSGGEFKLVQVIKEMMQHPHLMIMDEPDVFLDFENINALKSLITSYKGTLLVITHNRYLLTHCFNKILHLENKELQEFDGSYIDYNFALLNKKIELQELATADTLEIERNEALIDKLRTSATDHASSSKGKTLKARIKIQERLEARRIKAPFVAIKQPCINLYTKNPVEELTAIKVTDYTLAFEDILLKEANFEIKSNEKIALLGANGTGKTTLLREIFKNNNPSIQVDPSIQMAYLSQIQGEMLDEADTILNIFLEDGFKTNQEVIEYVKPFGFDDVYQKIGKLSGGEKNILQLAKICAHNPNMLLLDEPTSHLDTYSQLALEKALTNYNGGILMVSHDFYSIVNCMDYALIIENQEIRKISMRKFRKMMYARHFDKDYLELEQKKKALETQIEFALSTNAFEKAKVLSEKLEQIIQAF